MPKDFDPYLKWLGIGPEDQPPNHYRLLGIDLFMDDPEVIENAADRQMAHVRSFQTGRHAALSQRILNEIAKAKVCLLDPRKKAEYDKSIAPKRTTDRSPRLQVTKLHRGAAPAPRTTSPQEDQAVNVGPVISIGNPTASHCAHRSRQRRGVPVLLIILGAVGVVVVIGFIVATNTSTAPNRKVANRAKDDGVRNPPSTDRQTPATPPGSGIVTDPPLDQQAPARLPVRVSPTQLPAPALSDAPVDEPDAILERRDSPIEPESTDPATDLRPVEAEPTEKDARHPIPDAESSAKALAAVREVFRFDNQQPTTPKAKIALAQRMIQTVVGSNDDAATQYELLRVGREVAAGAGDVALTMDAIDKTAERFAVDTNQLVFDAILRLANSARMADQYKLLNDRAATVSTILVDTDRYVPALQLAEAMLKAARRTKDIKTIKQAVAKQRGLEVTARRFRVVERALATLKADPKNAAANLVVGKYRCFVKGNWQDGLPMLAKGSDSQIKAVCVLEIAEPMSLADQVAVGDAWWNIAKSGEENERKQMRLRAARWYRKVLPGSSEGLTRAKIQQRLAELKDERDVVGETAKQTPKTEMRRVLLRKEFRVSAKTSVYAGRPKLSRAANTGIFVRKGQEVRIVASGQWVIRPKDGPKLQFVKVALGQVGQTLIYGCYVPGEVTSFTVPGDGYLFLGTSEGHAGTRDNSGSVVVRLEIRE